MFFVETSGNRKTFYVASSFDAPKKVVRTSRQAYIEYKALSFTSENLIAKANYNVKGARAVFDPDLGPSGGYRCPSGTQYGGYITDRFGRGCGGGIIRRVGRALANTGMRLEDLADRRDNRRRNRAIQRRMKPNQPGQRRERMARAMERGARRLVDAYSVENLGPNSGGRPQRRNIPEAPKKRTAVVKPKPKPKRVVKAQAEKKPARPQGRAPVKPKVTRGPRVPKQPTRKPSDRNQGIIPASETLARELVSSGPTGSSRQKLAQIIIEGLPDRETRKAALDALITNIEGKLQKLGELPDLSKLSGEERRRAERNIEELRGWMSELNAAKQIRKNIDSGPNTSNISARLRNQIDRQNMAISRMPTNELRNRLRREGFLADSNRSRRGPGLDTLLDEEEMIAQAQARAEAAQEIARREASRAARSEVSRRTPTPTVSKPVQRTASTRSSRVSRMAGAVIPALRAEKRREQVVKPFAPLPSAPGAIPIPEPIENPNINSLQKAKQHFNEGGDLAEVPHQWWHAVLEANAALPSGEARVRKMMPNGGAIKQVQIFVFNDTNQGLVFNRKRGEPDEAIREVMAQNIMVALGLNAAPARMDGKNGGRAPDDIWAVMPFAWNFAPAGKAVGVQRANENYKLRALKDLPDEAVKERLGGLLFNYAMGIVDRHDQNGMADVFEDENGVLRPFVMPIDMGWFGRGWGNAGLSEYAGDYWMDPRLLADIKNVLAPGNNRLTTDQRIQLHEDLMNVYDEFLERLKTISNMNDDDFVDNFMRGMNVAEAAQIYNWTPQMKRDYELQVKAAADRALSQLRKARVALENSRADFIASVLGGDAINA